MAIITSKSNQLLEAGLNARAMRQDLISSNIANIDTPFYKARDIDFESALIEKKREIYGQNSTADTLEMAQTDTSHLKGITDFDSSKSTLYLRDGHMARNDGNTVDLDVETSELGKNAMMFDALMSGLRKNGLIFKSVLESSEKI
ncbi:flagellar basal body rod protein FlgB [Sulfurospirillum deleyianum]|uniref:Flagellar basal body rod protein FlgB n=1 Tax=Sulfurospirillum deleyianum (strain ATCC 51133 / DSM 6946 / 5175) TaxID=525898 RepID=D1B3L9_SULD5|nr:flagellar basal body rod protein FlgB [Sulfurospirillum deleyianum]ACZ12689.1 flagellar basal-body rod protein FlgB [Sulfurospirillum deleyianum DSM 6946]